MLQNFNLPLFGKERKVRVYIPSDFKETGKRFPVLYMHDGQNVFGNEEAIGGVALELHDYLEKNHVNLMVVAIDQDPAGEERVNDYCPWKHGEFSNKLLSKPATSGGKGKEYADFIVNVLKPLIDREYPTLVNETYMAGISLGALITTYAACTYPYTFKRIAGLSSGFYRNQEEIEMLMKNTNLSQLEKLYLDCGTMEAGDNHQLSELFLQSNHAIFDIVRKSGAEAELKVIEGALHNYETFKKRFPEVISYLI